MRKPKDNFPFHVVQRKENGQHITFEIWRDGEPFLIMDHMWVKQKIVPSLSRREAGAIRDYLNGRKNLIGRVRRA